jgi:hypothetical protein
MPSVKKPVSESATIRTMDRIMIARSAVGVIIAKSKPRDSEIRSARPMAKKKMRNLPRLC